jgi:DNA-directed RNA polymerase subunit RPC12/RpoP
MKCPTCKGDKIVKDEDGNEVQCPYCKGRGKVLAPSMM